MPATYFKNIFNRRSAKKYGWTPAWFHAKDFDGVLVKRIKIFQTRAQLFSSGICGLKTYKYILLHRLQNIRKRKTNYKYG